MPPACVCLAWQCEAQDKTNNHKIRTLIISGRGWELKYLRLYAEKGMWQGVSFHIVGIREVGRT